MQCVGEHEFRDDDGTALEVDGGVTVVVQILDLKHRRINEAGNL